MYNNKLNVVNTKLNVNSTKRKPRKVIKVKRVSSKQLQKLWDLGYLVIIC